MVRGCRLLFYRVGEEPILGIKALGNEATSLVRHFVISESKNAMHANNHDDENEHHTRYYRGCNRDIPQYMHH